MGRSAAAVLSLEPGAAFADRVAETLGAERVAVEERAFEDGEVKMRPLADLRGRHAVIVQSLDGGAEGAVHDRLCRVLFLAGALRDAGVARLSGVFPYLAYARKDRRTKPWDPLSLRYVAQILETVGVETVMALEVHDLPAFENAFRIPTVPLDMHRLFADRLAPDLENADVVVVAPDPGGLKRAQLFQEMLEERLGRPCIRAVADKRRSRGVVTGDRIYGEVEGCQPVIVDDLVSSGGTLARAAEALVEAGARSPIVAVAHGVFAAEAAAKLGGVPIARLLVTDSISPGRLDTGDLPVLEVVSCADLVAEAVRCLLDGTSISDLLGHRA
jgi:ribose-phosphate pyrophosphokinase